MQSNRQSNINKIAFKKQANSNQISMKQILNRYIINKYKSNNEFQSISDKSQTNLQLHKNKRNQINF